METFLQDDLSDFLEKQHTCPALAHLLLDSLHYKLYGWKMTFKNRHGIHDPQFLSLFNAQTTLGWPQLFQGRLVSDWGHLQEAFLHANNDTLNLDRRYFTGAIWTRMLISLLWVGMRAQWDHRNLDRHGATKTANHAIRHQRLLNSITAMYHEAPLMLAADTAILPASPIRLTKKHPTGIELWLKRTRAIVNRSKQDSASEISRPHGRLHHFFRHRRLKKTPRPIAESS
jgi:hypothetical protein